MLSVSERIVSQLAQFVIFLVAARLLGPAEFGLFALVSACAFLLLRVAEAAWSPFIMSRESHEQVPFQVLFLAILHGLALGLLGAAAALTAGKFGLPHDVVVLAVLLSFWVAMANAFYAQKGILIWMDRMKAAAMSDIGGELAGLVVAVYALYAGSGVLSLVYGRLASHGVGLVLTFIATRRLPMRGLPPDVLKELWSFSLPFFFSRMLIQARLQFVTLIVGAFLGPVAVGFFRAAERIAGAMTELIMVPAQMLGWMQLRRARDTGDKAGRKVRVRAQAVKNLKIVVALGAPLFIWVMLMNGEIVRGLLGDEWAPAAPLLAILALGRMMLFPGALTEPLLSILGKVRYLPGFVLRIFVMSIAITLATAPFGVLSLVWGQTLICALIMILTYRLFERHAGIPWGDLIWPLRRLVLPLASGVAVILLVDMALATQALPELVGAVISGLVGGVVYAATLAVFDPTLWQQVSIIKRLFGFRTQEAP